MQSKYIDEEKITTDKLRSYGRLKTNKESDGENWEIKYIKWRGAVTQPTGHWGYR